MNLQNELFAILSQYRFVHMDRLGRFSILVPLTGARTVCEQFNVDSNNPVSLYLFGDNTCKSDIERRKFFDANNYNFDQECTDLIGHLGSLSTRFRSRTDDYEVIQKLVELLQSDKAKALAFQGGNPGLELMTNDLRAEGHKIISKGEFIVTGSSDSVRYLNLPNILTILNPETNTQERLLHLDKVNDYLANLARIAKPESDRRLIAAITFIVRQPNIGKRLNESRESVFRAVYGQLRSSYPFLNELDQASLETYVEQFSYLVDDNENFTEWGSKDIIESIMLVFTQARLLDETQSNPMNRFAKIYHHALDELSITNRDEVKTNTYKLFILQSFLYLCALQIRLKNPECVNAFLTNIKTRLTMSQMIVDLCTNESALIQRLNVEFGISAEEYGVLLSSCHQIAIDHLDVPHFDELRTACMPLEIENTQYLIIGGCLCWSTSPITDYGNVNSASMQKDNFAARFRTLFLQMKQDKEIKEIKEILSLLNEALNAGAEYEEIALSSLQANIELFSAEEQLELLATALVQEKYRSAKLMLLMGVDGEQLFQYYFNQKFNLAAAECFLYVNPDYAHALCKDDLVEAQKNGQDDKVRLILKYKAELTNTDRPRYQHDLILKPRFAEILENWQNKANSLSQSNHHSASLAATRLFEQLTTAGDRFFSYRLSQKTINEFEKECKRAFSEAKPVMDSHRGWHGFPLFFRAVLGFIAAITVIPAVIVALATSKGYAGIFFKCPETNSTQRLAETQSDVYELCRLSVELKN